MKITEQIARFRTPKSALAVEIGIHRVQLYAYLNPQRYPEITMTDETLTKIAAFEGRSLRTVRAEYEARKAEAA
jgi:hypothetical protein